MKKKRGIPTTYKHYRFRSRLEAKWARFFDLMGWKWEYEPFDLDGYIPDFSLAFKYPMIVEVKPEMDIKSLEKHAAKIDDSGWKHEALIVGATLMDAKYWDNLAIGLYGQVIDAEGNPERCWDEGLIFKCGGCNKNSFFHSSQSWGCQLCSLTSGDSHLSDTPHYVKEMWAEAGNTVQWQPS